MGAWTLLIASHALAAGYALVFGAVNLVRRRKGDRPHRGLGAVWIAAMYWVAGSSFAIRGLNGHHLSALHALSALTLLTVSLGLLAATRHQVRAHAAFMAGSYVGLIGAFVGVVSVPSRRVPQLAAHQPLIFLAAVAVVGASAATLVATLTRHRKTAPAAANA